MAVMPVLIYGNPKLHLVSESIKEFDDKLHELIDDMFETMYEYKGIGLAAPQVGVSKRLIVIDIGEYDEGISLLTLINPELLSPKGSSVFDEGCLSIPDITGDVERPEEITARFLNKDGEQLEIECDGLLARVIQHEYDHLDGFLFPQKMLPAEKKKIDPLLRKLIKGKVT